MVKIVWFLLITISIIYSFLTNNIEAINTSILSSPKLAYDTIIFLLPTIVLWSGIMKIAEDSGLLIKFSNLLRPILKRLFPNEEKDSKALGYISSNIAANMMGLGSAATPFGLKAMIELQKNNPKKDTATDSMITFLVLNTGGVTIIPTTIIALRLAYNGNPTIIMPLCIIATFSSCISAVVIDYFFRRRK